jgi:hypothetical protein
MDMAELFPDDIDEEDSVRGDWAGGEGHMGHEGAHPGAAASSMLGQVPGSDSSRPLPSPPEGEAMDVEALGGMGQEEGAGQGEGEDHGATPRPHVVRDEEGLSLNLCVPGCLKPLDMAYHKGWHFITCIKCKGGAIVSVTASSPQTVASDIWTHAANHIKDDGAKSTLRSYCMPQLLKWAKEQHDKLERYYCGVGLTQPKSRHAPVGRGT